MLLPRGAALLPSDAVLDTSAIVTVLQGEAGTDKVLDVLGRARRRRLVIYTGFLCVMEVEYGVLRRGGTSAAERALAVVLNWPLTIVESNPDWRHQAAVLKARGGLSLADAWIAALALSLGAELFHKDKEFDSVPGLRSVRL